MKNFIFYLIGFQVAILSYFTFLKADALFGIILLHLVSLVFIANKKIFSPKVGFSSILALGFSLFALSPTLHKYIEVPFLNIFNLTFSHGESFFNDFFYYLSISMSYFLIIYFISLYLVERKLKKIEAKQIG